MNDNADGGHRKKLRNRFLKDYGETMPDCELLEMLLMMAQPRKNMKPLAKKLLKEFKSYANIIQTDKETLQKIPECGEAIITALKLANTSALRLLREEAFASEHILDGWDKVMDYCQTLLARAKNEQLRALFLSRKNRLIGDELIHTGTIDQAPFYPREIIKRALDLGAGAIILVHNHPSGDPKPSKEDIEVTLKLKKALDVIDIDLHDHVIIARNSYVSMRSKGIFS